MRTKRLSLIPRDDLDEIHAAALRVLERLGVVVDDPSARSALAAAGAMVEEDGPAVRLPRQLVLESLAQAPRQYSLTSPDGHVYPLPAEQPYLVSRAKLPRFLDYGAALARVPTRTEVSNLCRLANALREVRVIHTTDGPTEDLPDEANWLVTPGIVLSYCGRQHIGCAPIHLKSARAWVEVVGAACGGVSTSTGPILSAMVSTHGPLRLDRDSADVLQFMVKQGAAILAHPMPMSGATSPLTLAGTLVVGCAEMLFLITLAQRARPGTPILFGGIANSMHMPTGNVDMSGPEAQLFSSAEVALAKYYGLPSYRATAFTAAHRTDVQAGIEKTASAFYGIASGADVMLLGGSLDSAASLSYEQVVVDHDIWEYALRSTREIVVDADTLAEDVILRLGHGGGYLTDDHTLQWLRKGEHCYSGSFSFARSGVEDQSMLARAHARVGALLGGKVDRSANPSAVGAVADLLRSRGMGEYLPL